MRLDFPSQSSIGHVDLSPKCWGFGQVSEPPVCSENDLEIAHSKVVLGT